MTGWLTRLVARWNHLTRWVLDAARRVYRLIHDGATRIADRWHDDGGFRRTLSTAISAVTATAIPSPALSAAVSAYLADQPRRATAPLFDDYDEDDEPPGWPPRSRRLWNDL